MRAGLLRESGCVSFSYCREWKPLPWRAPRCAQVGNCRMHDAAYQLDGRYADTDTISAYKRIAAPPTPQ